jgi:hypothetical protein
LPNKEGLLDPTGGKPVTLLFLEPRLNFGEVFGIVVSLIPDDYSALFQLEYNGPPLIGVIHHAAKKFRDAVEKNATILPPDLN